MNTFRKLAAIPFFAIGTVFMAVSALILGDQHVDWLETPRQTHH
jgi:hypothetical protein